MSRYYRNYNSHSTSAESSISTKANVDKVDYSWTINNFDFLEATGKDIRSLEFSTSTNDKVKWVMHLAPSFKKNNSKFGGTDVAVSLFLSDSSEHKEVLAKYSVCFFNNKTNFKEQQFITPITVFKAPGLGDYKFIEKDTHFNTELLSENKTLKISGTITFCPKNNMVVEHLLDNASSQKVNTVDQDIVDDFGVLLKTHLLSDVIISVKSKEFPAHKAVLTARSKVFAAMFQHDMKENQLNRIEIEDISEEVFVEMLQFIYTGRCSDKLDKLAVELYVAADKYDLSKLKIICLQDLCKNLSISNVVQNFIFADTHGATELKSEALKFIVAKAAKVFDTAEWKKILNTPRLSEEVFRAMARR